MPLIDMHDYTPKARLYWWTVAALGSIVLLRAIVTVAGMDGGRLVQVLIIASIAAIVGLFPVRIPGTKTSLAVGDIVIFLALLLYGPAPAILAAALEGLVGSWRSSKRWTSRIGTPAMASIAMMVCATIFEAARSYPGTANSATLLTLLFALALLYFICNMMLTSTLIALKRGMPIAPIQWLKEFSWIGLVYIASASIAGLLFTDFEKFGFSALMVYVPIVPIVAVFLSILHFHFRRKNAAEAAQSDALQAAQPAAEGTERA
jgi:hypothetical protein